MSESETLRVGIGIITYNGPTRTAAVLKSIRDAQPYPEAAAFIGRQIVRCGTVVIDDGSTHKNVRLLREICNSFSVPLGEHRRNQGIAAAWNHAISDLVKMGNSDIAILLNDDVKVSFGWLEALVHFLYRNPSCAMAGLHAWTDGELLVTDGGVKKDATQGIDFLVPHRGLCANGFCFGLWVTDWRGAPQFDEEYQSFYEEVDFGVRLAQQGKLSYNIPWPVIEHEWGTTFYENQDLVPETRMNLSRTWFKEKWGGDVADLYGKLVTPKPGKPLHWLIPNTDRPGISEASGLPQDVVR